MSDTAVFRTYTPTDWTGIEPNADITITTFNAMYLNVKWGSVLKSLRVGSNETHTLEAPAGMSFNDTETIIYGASLITSLGDLSALYVGSVDVSKMIRLKELLIGSGVAGYRNYNMKVLSVGTNKLLQKLDIRNCPNLTQAVDLSQCDNIEEVYAEGSSITAVALPDGGRLSLLHLPKTVSSLNIMNQLSLTDSGLQFNEVDNLTTIRWENSNNANVLNIIGRCFVLDEVKLERIRLIGVDWFISTLDLIVKLINLQGMDEHGNNTDKSVITGKCYVAVANDAYLAKLRAAFPELVITYGQLKPATTTTFVFKSSQGKEITNAEFTCNLDYEKVNDYTYKVIAEDGTKVETTFKCDNHQDCINTYIVATTRTQTYTATYIPLRTIRVKVYNQSVYVPGASVVINNKTLLADSGGYVTHRGGEAVSGSVSAYGYGDNTFSFSAITNDTSHTVEVYPTVEVKFVVKFGSTLVEGVTVKAGTERGITNVYGECVLALPKGSYDYTVTSPDYITKTGTVSVGTSAKTVNVSIEPSTVEVKFIVRDTASIAIEGATVRCEGLTGITNSDGECTMRVSSKQTHSYEVEKYGYFTKEGVITVSVSTVTANVSILFNAEIFKPLETGNIQMLVAGPSATLNITSLVSNYIIDWGDGTIENASGVGAKAYSHTYADSRNYQVEVKNCQDITACNGTAACLVAYWGIGNSKVVNLSFNNYRRLSYVGLVLKNDDKRTSFFDCFYSCKNIITIPSGLFDNCPSVTDFGECFSNCDSLTVIPSGLFDNCLNVTNFHRCFYNCRSLTAIPRGLFDNCLNVTNFSSCFYSCESIITIPSGLFDNCANVTDFNGCFYSCKSIITIPSGLFDNCPSVTNFGECFSSCDSLATIPCGLFDNCPNVTNFSSCFYSCESIITIPSGLFDNCANVTDFNGCFYSCKSIITIPSGLFDNCPSVTNFSRCFYYCDSLTTIPNGLFDSCPSVTSFSDCFSRCQSLTAIPRDLFDNCPNVTNFSYCFYSCSSLTAIPRDLFDNCPNVTNFSYCFSYCSKIVSALPPLWIQYYNKTVTKSNCFIGCSLAANWSEVPKSWGGPADEYIPTTLSLKSRVVAADYNALNARMMNIETALGINN